MYLTGFLLFNILASSVLAFYDGNANIVELNEANFDSRVLNSEETWIVEFYAPWCGHCKALVSEYVKLAAALKGVIKVGAVNAEEHKSLGQKYEIRGYPSIKVFGMNKNRPREYTGARNAHAMVDDVFMELRNEVEGKLAGKKSKKQGDIQDVVELTDANFKTTVLDSKEMWLVEFYAPWCGHCQRLAPEWAEAATRLKGKVKLGALDATIHTITSNKYNIKGFPTIKFFPIGIKDGRADEYDGGRKADDIVNWAMEMVADITPAPEVLEITNGGVIHDACEEDHPLCVIAILPHILDCQSKCRNEYLSILKKVGEHFRKNRWGYVWAEAMVQPHLETGLGIGGFGYPALAVVNVRKMKFSLFRGSFSYDGISEFIRTVSVGRGSSSLFKGTKLPEIMDSEPWDGKDGQLPFEEDIDLSDVELDEPSDSKKKIEL